jgi:hypothetical protein
MGTWDNCDDADITEAVRIHKRRVGRNLLRFFAQREIPADSWSYAKATSNESQTHYTHLIWFFRALDAAEFGWFIVGRRGKETRFKWRYAPTTILQMIQERAAEKTEHSDTAAEKEGAPFASAADPANIEMLEHSFRLRGDLLIKLSLPASFTKAEAGRLAMFVNSLPLDG